MTALNNVIGDRGESEVNTALLTPVSSAGYPEYLFYPHFLGAKAPMFDFLVYLLRTDGQPLGPKFFVQVKSTRKPATSGSCAAKCSAVSIKRTIAAKVPSYLVGVDLSKKTSSELYITGVSHSRKLGYATVPTTNRLHDEATPKNGVRFHFHVIAVAAPPAAPRACGPPTPRSAS